MAAIIAKVYVDGILPKFEQATTQTFRALKMAGSSALRAMRAEASRQIRQRKAIKASRVDDAMTSIFPAEGEFVWKLKVSAAPMPVTYFNVRQVAQGVRAEINRGSPTLIRGAFIAQMRSGHVGVFYRVGKKRLPIDEAFSSRISEVFVDAVPEIELRGRQVFLNTFGRLVNASGVRTAA